MLSDMDAKAQSIVALIPAHNEEEHLGGTLASLLRQTRPLDRIVVVADNCTDRTVSIARSFEGVEVIETVDNAYRKAGALNQGLEHVGREYGYLLQMDADTELDERFVEEAIGELEADPELGGVCSRFFAKDTSGILRLLQAMEYVRYDAHRDHRKGRVSVLSGTGVVLRMSALPAGRPWDEKSLVEDFELTLSLKRRGWKVKAGDHAVAYTDTMPTVSALWRQRLRWVRGTLEELRREGWQAYTRRDIFMHSLAAGAIGLRLLWVTAIGLTIFGSGHFHFAPIWLLPTLVVAAERMKSVWKLGWRARLAAVTLFPEEMYQLLREAYVTRAAYLALRRKAWQW
jgi:cellulose synthase/poly-beta-1,6-N-acetylglucosamine synthase-like glycosyltransferase